LYVDEWEGFTDWQAVGGTAEKSIISCGKPKTNKDTNFKV